MPHPGLLHPEPPPLRQSTADPYLHRRHSDTVLSQSLWGLWVLVCTRFVCALWASLAEMGFDIKRELAAPAALLGSSFALVPYCRLCCCLVTQSCPPLCDPMDCSPPGCSVHGDSPGRNTGVGPHFLLQEIFLTPPLSLIHLILPVSLKTWGMHLHFPFALLASSHSPDMTSVILEPKFLTFLFLN